MSCSQGRPPTKGGLEATHRVVLRRQATHKGTKRARRKDNGTLIYVPDRTQILEIKARLGCDTASLACGAPCGLGQGIKQLEM